MMKIHVGGLDGAGGPRNHAQIYDFWVPDKYVFMIILIRSWGYWPLEGPCNKHGFVSFFDPGPKGSGSVREAPEGPPWAFRGLRGPPRSLRDLRQTKAKNLET